MPELKVYKSPNAFIFKFRQLLNTLASLPKVTLGHPKLVDQILCDINYNPKLNIADYQKDNVEDKMMFYSVNRL